MLYYVGQRGTGEGEKIKVSISYLSIIEISKSTIPITNWV